MQRSVESPFDWKMYLVAVLHQESANYRTARGDQSSADFCPVHRPEGCCSAGRDAADPQQSFTKEKMLPENVAETSPEGRQMSLDSDFLPSSIGKRKGAICKQIEKVNL